MVGSNPSLDTQTTLMIVTNLKQQLKNPQRVSIFIDGKYGFSLNLDQLAKYKLKNGDELTEADIKKYKKISEDGKLRERALAWLLNRPHSTREFLDYMRRKKADPDFAQKLAEDFSAKNYLNDMVYAKWLVELKVRAGKSDRAIAAELFKKGIGREVAEEALAGSQAAESERLRQMIDKKRKFSRYKNDDTKLAKYLTSQGFSYELVKRHLNPNGYNDS